MELFHFCRRTGSALFAAVLAALLILTSCRGGSGESDRRRALSYLAPYKMNTEPSGGDLYDLTELTKDRDNTLCAYALFDETHIMLLKSRGTGRDGGGPYAAQLLDLTDGSLTDVCRFDSAAPLRKDPDETGGLSIISCDPLIVYDSRNAVIYRPGAQADSIALPEWYSGACVYAEGGRLWVSTDRGMVFEALEDGTLRKAWSLPCDYTSLDPVVTGHSGVLSFAAVSIRDPLSRVLIDVDPASGESRLYRSGLTAAGFSACGEGLLLGSSFRTAPKVSVCSAQDHTCRELTLPDEILSLLNGRPLVAASEDEDYIFFQIAPRSISGGWCSFMLCDSSLHPVSVYLWDAASGRERKWKGPSEEEYTAPPVEDYGACSRKAAEMESRYDVRIVLGSNIPGEFSDYSAQPVLESGIISSSLTVLDNTLSLYPDEYFTALKGSYYRDIVIYLTGSLEPLNVYSSIANAGAFSTDTGGLMQIAFDLYDDLRPATVIHELTHAADYRLIGEGLWDEEAWNAMNPEGFSYYNAYIDENGESYEFSGRSEHTAQSGCPVPEIYFIDSYSKTFPMEDRARLMEHLMSGRSPYKDAFRSAHLQEKLTYYFRFLRDTLGDPSWPEQTKWEEALESASSGQ